jgi:hypothetical protein
MTASERPIIFTADSVRAILAGTKTQARRVLRREHADNLSGAEWVEHDGLWYPCRDELCRGALDQIAPPVRCPYGGVGQRLWVREAWAPADAWVDGYEREEPVSIRYRADGKAIRYEHENVHELDTYGWSEPKTWRSPLFMPRWASRITLEITDVQVRRLQSVSEEDAQAEGVTFDGSWWLGGVHPIKGTPKCWPSAREAYSKEWDRINAKRGFIWESNPWVFAITFRLLPNSTPQM